MAQYHMDNRFSLTQQNLTTTFKTLVAAYTTSNVLVRGRTVAISVGADGTPNASDCAIVYAVTRYSTSTGTASPAGVQTWEKADAADPTARASARINFTSEPTYTSTALSWTRALNQRASMQWNAPDLDASIKWAATADAGVVLVALSPTYTSTVVGGLDVVE